MKVEVPTSNQLPTSLKAGRVQPRWVARCAQHDRNDNADEDC